MTNEERIELIKSKYGENRWWESEDLNTIAYYQFNEDILLVDFSLFHKAVEHLLNTPVFTHQFATLYKELKTAVNKAWSELS